MELQRVSDMTDSVRRDWATEQQQQLFVIVLLFLFCFVLFFSFSHAPWLVGSRFSGQRPGLSQTGAQSLNWWSIENSRPQGIVIGMRYPRGSHLSTRLYPTAPQTPLLETSGQTTSRIGTQSHPSNKQTKKKWQKNMLKMKKKVKKLQDLVKEEDIGSPSEK